MNSVLTPKATLCKRRQKERKSQRGWMTSKSHLNTVGPMHIGTHIAVCTGATQAWDRQGSRTERESRHNPLSPTGNCSKGKISFLQ